MSIDRRVVLDTDVVFEGLTWRQGDCSQIVDAWFNGLIQVCIFDALAYEYVDLLSRKLTPAKWQQARVVIRTLFAKAEFITIHYSWRPTSPDPGDDLAIDCTMNANASLVTYNLKDFRTAQSELGLRVVTPKAFARLLGLE